VSRRQTDRTPAANQVLGGGEEEAEPAAERLGAALSRQLVKD
jgi:hypothetical protein